MQENRNKQWKNGPKIKKTKKKHHIYVFEIRNLSLVRGYWTTTTTTKVRKNIEKKNREKIYYIIINDKTREKEWEYKKIVNF